MLQVEQLNLAHFCWIETFNYSNIPHMSLASIGLHELTFTAIITPLGTCLILSTTPYAPRPNSPICSKSSAFTTKFCSQQKHMVKVSYKVYEWWNWCTHSGR